MEPQFITEEELWRCPKHPSRHRRTGICHVCLRERLADLCPDCGKARPCSCSSTSASGPSPSSLFDLPSSSTGNSSRGVYNVEPSFHRSRSVAVAAKSASGLWSIFKSGSGNKSRRVEAESVKGIEPVVDGSVLKDDLRRTVMGKSRSVAAGKWLSESLRFDDGSRRGRGWHFASPMKALRQSMAKNSIIKLNKVNA